MIVGSTMIRQEIRQELSSLALANNRDLCSDKRVEVTLKL
jgi:hypothetical protein